MKSSRTILIVAALVALTACNKKTSNDNGASEVQANAENRADNVTASANNQARLRIMGFFTLLYGLPATRRA